MILVKRSILLFLIGTMLLMGQTGAIAAPRDHFQAAQSAGSSAAIIAKGVLNTRNLAPPMVVFAGMGNCCVCDGARLAKPVPPSARFSKITRAAGCALNELLQLQPPHDPPRI